MTQQTLGPHSHLAQVYKSLQDLIIAMVARTVPCPFRCSSSVPVQSRHSIECAICFENKNEQGTFACGHMFCWDCCKTLARNANVPQQIETNSDFVLRSITSMQTNPEMYQRFITLLQSNPRVNQMYMTLMEENNNTRPISIDGSNMYQEEDNMLVGAED